MSTNQWNEANRYIDEPPITKDIEQFFLQYASIASSNLRDHLKRIRRSAWEKHPYPCLARWGFLDFSIQSNPIYEEILHQCKTHQATLIDFGCCLGQDIRILIYNGVASNQLRGFDIDPFFIEQGYQLFADGDRMKQSKVFSTGDIFDDQFLNQIEPADYLYVGSFIHLFDAERQRDVCRRLTRLAKRAIAGRQSGASIPTEHLRLSDPSRGKMMRHSPESFTQMWNEVTHGQWIVENATLQPSNQAENAGQRLVFTVRKQAET